MSDTDAPKNDSLKVQIINDRLVISIGVDTLAYAFEQTGYAKPYDSKLNDWKQKLTVVDPLEFAKEVCILLQKKQVDGTTPVSLLLDEACAEACDQGAFGVEEVK